MSVCCCREGCSWLPSEGWKLGGDWTCLSTETSGIVHNTRHSHILIADLIFKVEKNHCDEVLNIADQGAAILVIVGQTKNCVSAVLA